MPTPNVSVVDLVIQVEKKTFAEEVNSAFREAAAGAQKGVLAVSDLPLVSKDFALSDVSTTIDSSLTMVMVRAPPGVVCACSVRLSRHCSATAVIQVAVDMGVSWTVGAAECLHATLCTTVDTVQTCEAHNIRDQREGASSRPGRAACLWSCSMYSLPNFN